MTQTVLIADDEEDARELLKLHLKRHGHFILVGEAQNGHEALAAIQQQKPDIVLLDIQMPEMNGIELVEQLDPNDAPRIVFITAYDQFAVKAFELNAVDYLLKPFSKSRFDDTMKKVASPTEKQDLQSLLSTMMQMAPQNKFLARLTYRDGPTTRFIPVEEILMVESADQYIEAYTPKKKYLIRLSMDYLENVLDPALFFRTHRSYLVNIQFVESIEQYEPRNFLIHLTGGVQAKLSREKREFFNRKLLGEF